MTKKSPPALTAAQQVSRLTAENRKLRLHGIGNNVTKVLQSLIKYGTFFGMVYYAQVVLVAWAGKTTVADVRINASAVATATAGTHAEADSKVNSASLEALNSKLEASVKKNESLEKESGVYRVVTPLALLLSVLAILYGRSQAKLRRSVIKRFSPYQQQLEQAVHTTRTSSGLTKTGETQEKDL